jgi:hypothetical protein
MINMGPWRCAAAEAAVIFCKEGLPGGIHTAAPAPQDGWELVPPKQAVRRFLNVV